MGNSISQKFQVALVGLGNVGYGNYLSKKSEQILDHFSAIEKQSDLELVICVDQVKPNSISVPFINNINDMSSVDLDLLVVATPTDTHLEVIKQFMYKNNTKMLLVEKPCSISINQIRELVDLFAERSETQVFINYHRNYNRKFRDSYSNERLGSLQSGVVHYSNGAVNNASHALALILPILESISGVYVIGGSLLKSHLDFDFSIENVFGSRVVFLATNENLYSNFRIELDFENGVVSYDSSKGEIRTRVSVSDPDFNNRRSLEPIGQTVGTNEQSGFEHVYNFLVSKLRKEVTRPGLGVDLKAAMKIHEVFEELKNS